MEEEGSSIAFAAAVEVAATTLLSFKESRALFDVEEFFLFFLFFKN